jgi:hypothetical protein
MRGNARINVTLRRVRVTIIAVEKQKVVHILKVSVAAVTEHAKGMNRIILLAMASLALP